MRPPPPLRDAAKYPVTGVVAIAAAAVSVAFLRGSKIDSLVLDVRTFDGQPWRALTSTLPHVSVLHLVFNVLWLWSFGTLAERRFGSLRYALLLLLLAFGSGTADYAVATGGVGLSGVVYGLFALLAVLQRTDPELAGAVDSRTIALFVGWFFFCIVTTLTGMLAVANVAHGAGAALGVLVAWAVAYKGLRRAGSIVATTALLLLTLACDTVARPRVNFSHDRGADAAVLAYHAYQRNDDVAALRYGRMALRMNPRRADWWYNAALAARRLHDEPTAIDALRRALAIDPSESSARAVLADLYFQRGFHAEAAGHDEDAVREYRASLAVQESATTHFDLGTAYEHVGRAADAEASFRRAVALDPSEPHRTTLAGLLRSRAYDAGVARHHDEAIRFGVEAMGLDANSAPGWFNLGIEYEAMHRWPEAADAFERAAHIAPSDSQYRNAAADSWVQSASEAVRAGRSADALAALDHAVALGADPAEVDPIRTLATLQRDPPRDRVIERRVVAHAPH